MTTDLTAADHVLAYYADVELDNGENLRDLNVGDHLELSEPTAGMAPGTWQVVAWHGDDPAFPDEAVMRPVPASEIAELRRAASERLASLFTPAVSESTDDPICGDRYDDEACELDPGHDGAHCAGTLCWSYDDATPALSEESR